MRINFGNKQDAQITAQYNITLAAGGVPRFADGTRFLTAEEWVQWLGDSMVASWGIEVTRAKLASLLALAAENKAALDNFESQLTSK